MSGSYFDADWTAKVTVPVKRVGERWEFFYGGDVPVREGTLGELTLSAEQSTDESFRQRVMQEPMVQILDEGTDSLVALSDRDRDINGRRAGAFISLPSACTPVRRSSSGHQRLSLSWYELWAKLEQTLGWRPAPPVSNRKRKRT